MRSESPWELSVAPFVEVAGEVFGEFVCHPIEHFDFRTLNCVNEEERSKCPEHTFPEVLDFEQGGAILRHLLHPHDVAVDEVAAQVAGLDHCYLGGADELEADGFVVEGELSAIALVRGFGGEGCQSEPAGENH